MLHGPASKTNHKLVRTHSAPFWCWDKPRATLDSLDSPRPKLGGGHHLPPYSIFCVAPPRPCPSGSLSRDSQSEVPKLSRNCPGLDSWDFGPSQLLAPIFDRDELLTNLVALFDGFPMPCCTAPTHVRIGSILNFLWSGVKPPV